MKINIPDKLISALIPSIRVSLSNGTAKLNHRISSYSLRINSALKKTTYLGTEYLVVPVISQIGDSVVYAVNGPGPELIPSNTLSLYPEQRNGRAVCMGHPKDATGEYVLLTEQKDTTVFNAYAYGFWMNNTFNSSSNRIEGELWLSKDRANSLGSQTLINQANSVISRVESDGVIEISEGNWVVTHQEEGEYKGEKYTGIWYLAIADHIATLKEGDRGACSVTMGCGAGGIKVNRAKEGNIEILNKSSRLNHFNNYLALPSLPDVYAPLERLNNLTRLNTSNTKIPSCPDIYAPLEKK